MTSLFLLVNFKNLKFISFWFIFISNFSMYQLIVKDEIKLTYFSLQILFSIIFFYFQNFLEKTDSIFRNIYFKILFSISILGSIVIHILIQFINPPERYPHLFFLFMTSWSFLHFFILFLFSIWKVIEKELQEEDKIKFD